MTYSTILILFALWCYGLAVAADRTTHEANERLSETVEDGALASRWGNNATLVLRTVAGVGLATVALWDGTWTAVGAVAAMLLFLAYFTLGVAWRNYLILIGRGDLERRYEESLWDEIIWIRYYLRKEW
jgi:hypothetical protein